MNGVRVALTGAPADLELAGCAGRTSWGDVLAAAEEGALHVELVRDGSAAAGALAWDAASATVLRAGAPWRRLPWPAGEQAFALPAAALDAGALIAGPSALTAPVAERLRERGARAVEAERFGLDALRAASVVCLPVAGGAPLPAEAMAVLAARRILVTGRCAPSCGLQPGIDCFMEATAEGAAQRVQAALAWPEAFGVVRALGRVAAERHRASVLLHRLAVDAALGVG